MIKNLDNITVKLVVGSACRCLAGNAITPDMFAEAGIGDDSGFFAVDNEQQCYNQCCRVRNRDGRIFAYIYQEKIYGSNPGPSQCKSSFRQFLVTQ